MTKDEIAYEQRKQRRLERLGTNNPRCACGETYWACFEEHHVAGRAHDDAQLPTCANCHRKLTQPQKAHPLLNPDGDARQQWAAQMLFGFVDLLRWLADLLYRVAKELHTPSINIAY
jgi:hypothetical protein